VRPLRVSGSRKPTILHEYGDYPAWLDRVNYACAGGELGAGVRRVGERSAGLARRRRAHGVRQGPQAHLSAPTAEYLDPLFFVLGANLTGDRVLTLFEGFHAASLSLRSCLLVGRRKEDLRLPDDLTG
jgi:aromatic ring-opening dioxygenase catalytic subunit (LigB family)